MTLQELKQITGLSEPGKRVPTVRHLKNDSVEIICKRLGKDAQIAVYQNGYAVYQIGNRTTVFSIHSCGDYLYKVAGKIICIGSSYFNKQEWYVRLILEGEDRLSINQDERERNNHISFSVIPEERVVVLDVSESPLEQIVRSETVAELLNLLTERQRLVVCLFFFCRKTQKEISDELGITVPTVSKTISQALRRMRKSNETELAENWRGGMTCAW